MAALRSHTMVTGKDDLTKASGIGYAFGTMCGKPPCGCPECIDGSSRYHQSELGFVDGLRSAGKNGVLANFGQPRGRRKCSRSLCVFFRSSKQRLHSL